MLKITLQTYLVASAIIFGVVSLIHLIRAINNWSFVIGPITVPIVVSWVGFLITASLCLVALRLATKGMQQQ